MQMKPSIYKIASISRNSVMPFMIEPVIVLVGGAAHNNNAKTVGKPMNIRAVCSFSVNTKSRYKTELTAKKATAAVARFQRHRDFFCGAFDAADGSRLSGSLMANSLFSESCENFNDYFARDFRV